MKEILKVLVENYDSVIDLVILVIMFLAFWASIKTARQLGKAIVYSLVSGLHSHKSVSANTTEEQLKNLTEICRAYPDDPDLKSFWPNKRVVPISVWLIFVLLLFVLFLFCVRHLYVL